jgi:hypothetical protein
MPIPAVTTTSTLADIPIPDFAVSRSRRSVITWTTSSGETLNLTAGWSGSELGMAVGLGIKGFDAPPINLVLDDLPAQPGAAYRQSKETYRELFVPIVIYSQIRDDYLDLKRYIMAKLMTRQNLPGTLSVYETSPSGEVTVRSIDCFYAGGMEGDEQEAANYTYSKHGLVLRCPDPFWYGLSVNSPYSLAGASPTNFFTGKARGSAGELTGPFLPFSGLSAVWVATGVPQTITIQGDAETWPIWTINGKGGAQFVLSNISTGKSLTLNYDFTAGGDTVTIDTRPGIKTAVNNAGASVWPYFSSNPKLWEFLPGDNMISFALTLAGGASSVGITGNVTLAYKPRYLGA